MSELIKKIKSKYMIKNIFEYLTLYPSFQLIKYNKKLLSLMEFDKNKIKFIVALKKYLKPIANCEDYLPILKRIYTSDNLSPNNISKLYYNYCHGDITFTPQINKINENEELLNSLYSFKIGFNKEFIDYFYDKDKFEFKKLMNFCDEYASKIKEITFMDNNIPNIQERKECYFILRYIIKSSNIIKIEDRNIENDKSILLKLFDFDYNENINEDYYIKNYKPKRKQKDIIEIINELKYYSLYIDEYYNINNIIKSFIDIILLNAKNLEELKITKINEENSLHFITLLKNLKNLKSLSITSIPDNELFNDISNVINDNSLNKLEMNLNYFDEGINIINKNLNSLKELIIKIKYKREDSLQIVQTLSKIVNLTKLKIIAKIPIINEDNIKYLSFNNLKYLEMPLYIKKSMFNLNNFFGKTPNLETIIFNEIHFSNNITIRDQQINLNVNLLKNLKKIKFLNCQKKSSFFIKKILDILSPTKIKDNIKEIKIENCEFDDDININALMKSISYYNNISNLQLNNISFQKWENFYYNRMNNFIYLKKFYFKGLDCEQTNIHLLSFLSHLSEKCKYLIDIGLSCKNLNSDDMNLILRKLKNFKYLMKANIFDNYKLSDYYAYRDKVGIRIIDFNQIIGQYMIDLRNLNIKKNTNNIITKSIISPKIVINDDFCEINYKIFSNKQEKYYSYQNLFNKNANTKIMYYLKDQKSFIIDEIILSEKK